MKGSYMSGLSLGSITHNHNRWYHFLWSPVCWCYKRLKNRIFKENADKDHRRSFHKVAICLFVCLFFTTVNYAGYVLSHFSRVQLFVTLWTVVKAWYFLCIIIMWHCLQSNMQEHFRHERQQEGSMQQIMEDYQFRKMYNHWFFFPSLHNKTWHLIYLPKTEKKKKNQERILNWDSEGKNSTGLANLSGSHSHGSATFWFWKLISMKGRQLLWFSRLEKRSFLVSCHVWKVSQGLLTVASCQMSVIIMKSESASRSVLSDSLQPKRHNGFRSKWEYWSG